MPRKSIMQPQDRHSDSSVYRQRATAGRRSTGGYHWNLRSFASIGLDDTMEDDDDDDDDEQKEWEGMHAISERTMEDSMRSADSSGNNDNNNHRYQKDRRTSTHTTNPNPLRGRNQQRYSGIATDIFCRHNNHHKNNNNGRTSLLFSPSSPPGSYPVESCKGLVDGREVTFELRQSITNRPTTDRLKRLKRTYKNINCQPSSLESQIRFWLMKCKVYQLSAIYMSAFVGLNVLFAALFFVDEDKKCCNDGDFSFGQVFAFTIQTSTTIGYGGYVPAGYYANFLVVLLSFLSTLLNTIFAGLIFARFVRPEAKLVFSDVMTYSNFNGLPCLQLRVGNVDGWKNKLTNVEARLTYVYLLDYEDENGNKQQFGQTEELKLLNDKQQIMRGVWTLCHVLDEKSPLFGLDLFQYPGSAVIEFRVSITATQQATQGPITEQTGYMKEDVMIGHAFDDQASWDPDTHVVINDYSKMSATHPQPVWYPSIREHIMP